MNLKIKTSQIHYDVTKAVAESQSNGYELEDITPAVRRVPCKPTLLSTLLDSQAQKDTLQTNVFKYDETIRDSALPDGKAYSEHGGRLEKERPRRLMYEVPSFGVSYNVAPEDYANRRKPGTEDFLTEDDVLEEMTTKGQDTWDNFDEVGISQLLTTGTNIVRGGPFESYDFYADIAGTTQETEFMDLSNSSIDHEQAFRKKRREITQQLSKYSDSASSIVCICGDNFFDDRYEIQKNEGLARPIKFGLDLASQPIQEGDFGTGTFNYAYFDSQDGIRYINYGSEIIAGEKLIDDDEAILMPMGASNLLRMVYAPARTRTYVNTEALEMYSWTSTSERQGVTVWQESNVLFSLINPLAVKKLSRLPPS